MATKRGNVPTQSWRGKSAVFRIYSALTSHGYSKSIKAVKTAEESRTTIRNKQIVFKFLEDDGLGKFIRHWLRLPGLGNNNEK